LKRFVFVLLIIASVPVLGALATAQEPAAARDPQAVERLRAETAAMISINPATGTARFVRFPAGASLRFAGRAGATASAQDRHEVSLAVLREYRGAFGLREDPAAVLRLVGQSSDSLGGAHLTYAQSHRGVPVFGALLKTHFGPDGNLTAISGTLIPDISVEAAPAVRQEAAAGAALAAVSGLEGATNATVRGTRLLVYRTGLAQGVRGQNHLAWEVEVGNGTDVREFVYVSARTAKVLDRINAVQDALHRIAYNTEANFPATPFWTEGDPFPTGDAEADNVIGFSGETYNFYSDAFGRDSFDGAGETMHGVFHSTGGCPNASWNGIFTRFCNGVSPDDVVGHEWTHAYTQFTHGLIYAWQPGALNESYSDIYGEVVDLLNGTGSDSPGPVRSAGVCSAFTPFPPVVRVNSPANIAGVYPAGGAQFGPPLTGTGLTGDVVLVDDGVGAGVPPAASTTDGCQTPFANADVVGKIALVDRGTCSFAVKVKNAQTQGAIGVIVANHSLGGDALLTMAGADPTITIPSVFIGYTNGNLIKSELAAPVNATLRENAPAVTEDSYRWLVGEDATAFGGSIRDMWEPTCNGDPGKVSDAQYFCGTGDGGGVHSNSGVPNHGFSLLVDGGAYNGQAVAAIGIVKAAHIYYRAMTVYQGPASDFADHADALEQSCADLVGAPLNGFGGFPSEVIAASDCAEVANMTEAVELRLPPTQCNFQPLLDPNPPDRCEPDTNQVNIFRDSFERSPRGWTATHTTPSATFTERDWEWVNDLPGDRDGSAFFGVDPDIGTCSPEADESGVLHLTSPAIRLKSGVVAPRLTFDHWVATEAGWDGGNLKVSAGGGDWQLVAPGDFTFNPYNATLNTAPQGNTNPMAGEPAFTGSDGGSVEGSWGRSHVNLAPYAAPGQSFQLRWDLGTDGCAGLFGWYLDNVKVYTCTSKEKPTLSINDVAVTEGDSGFTDAVFTVTLSHAFDRPVLVHYRVKPGTARPGSDYIPGGGGHDRDVHRGGSANGAGLDGDVDHDDDDDDGQKIIIPALSISGQITVRVRGDRRPEPDETFFVVLSRPWNATIEDGVGQGTILNDDVSLTSQSSGPARGQRE
jgi:Zn-dependent metalloprotease